MHHGKRQINVFCFKSCHIIPMSRQRDLQWYFFPLAADHRPGQSLSDTKELRFKQTYHVSLFHVIILQFLNSYHDLHTTFSHITVFGPVTWLCQLKCQISLNRQFSPTRGSPSSAFKISFKCQTRRIRSTQRSGRSLWSGPKLGE